MTTRCDTPPAIAPLLEVQNNSVRSRFEEEEQRYPLDIDRTTTTTVTAMATPAISSIQTPTTIAPLLEVQCNSVRSQFKEEKQRFRVQKELDESIGYSLNHNKTRDSNNFFSREGFARGS